MTSMPEALVLGHICSKIGSGATPKGGKEVYLASGPYALIRSQNVLNDGFSNNGLAYISERQAKALDGVTVEPGDVLLNITGDSVARVCQAPKSALPARVNQHVAIIRPRPDVLDPSFLRYFLVSPEQQTLLLTLASSGATRNALTKGMIKQIEVPAVLIEEQKQIARILGSLDDHIDHNQALAANLEAIARRLFKSWFVDFDPVRAKAAGEKPTSLADDIAVLFPDRFVDSEIGEVPEGWGYRSLAAVASLNPDAWTTRKHPDSVNYIDLSNVKNGLIEIATKYMWESAPSRARRVLRIGDTIVGTVRPGNCSFAFVDHDGLTGSTGFAVLRPTRKTYREFLYFAATSDDAIDRLAHFADGAAYPAVRSDVVLATEIAIPSDAVMNKFSEVTRRVIDRASVCKREAVVLAHIRDILLPRLISGEIRVSDAHKQIEEALG